MRIAICDDDKDELARIIVLLDTYKQERMVPVSYKTFQSAVELLTSAKNSGYELFLLDIMMPGFSGMEAAHEIRSFDTEASIVFLTSSPEFAVESYAVHARDYILKPVKEERMFSVLDGIFAQAQNPQEGLSLKTQNGIARILFSKLAFVEVMNKRLYFHLSDGSVREVAASLSEFEEVLLSRPEFIRVHRSYIVNLWQVNELTASGLVTHTGKQVPISRLLYRHVKDSYVAQLFLEKEVR